MHEKFDRHDILKTLCTLTLALTAFGAWAKYDDSNDNSWCGTDGNWNVAENWSKGHVPTTSERAVFPATGSYTITVNDDCVCGSIEAPAASTITPFTIKGSGSITAAKPVTGPCVRGKRPLTLDGVCVTLNGEILIYTTLTLTGGARLVNTSNSSLTLYKTAPALDVQDGSVEVTGTLNNFAAATISVGSKGSVTCGNFKPFSDTAGSCALTIAAGGSFSCSAFQLQSGSSLALNGGALVIGGTQTLADDSTLNLVSGTITFGSTLTEKRFLTENKGCTIHATDIALATEIGETLTLDSSLIATNATFDFTTPVTLRSTEPLLIGRYRNAASMNDVAGARATIVAPTLVLGDKQPFVTDATGAREFLFYGPMTLRPTADMDRSVSRSVYPLFNGDIVIDTLDYNDGVTPRQMAFYGLGAEASASLTIRGGGSVWLRQTNPTTPFSAITIEAGTKVELADLSGVSDYGPLYASSFTLGANAELTIPAGSNCVHAASWSIDPTAKIIIRVNADQTDSNTFVVLTDLNNKLSAAGQISIEGEGAAGWTTAFERGTLVVRKAVADPSPSSTDIFEWTGAAGDGLFSTAANWSVNSTPLVNGNFVFGACDSTTAVTFDGVNDSGKTSYNIASLTFLPTALASFTISGNTMTLAGSSAAIISSSGAPQYFGMSFRVNRTFPITSYRAPVIFGGKNFQYDKGDGCQMLIVGDVRLATPNGSFPRINFNAPGSLSYQMTTGSRCTISEGGSMTITNQVATMLNRYHTGFYVCEGGTLAFKNKTGNAAYTCSTTLAKTVVDGLLQMDATLAANGYAMMFGGKGTLALNAAAPCATATALTLSDTLTVDLPAAWQTVAENADAPFTIRAVGAPTLRLATDFTYGAPIGFQTETSAAARAATVEYNSTLTVNANGHVATFADAVTGAGTLAITNGTLVTGTLGEELALRLDAAGVWQTAGDTSVAALTGAGGTVRYTALDPVTVTGDADVSKLTFALDETLLTQVSHWKTLLSVQGAANGQPTVADDLIVRTVSNKTETNYQVRRREGLIFLLK